VTQIFILESDDKLTWNFLKLLEKWKFLFIKTMKLTLVKEALIKGVLVN